MVTTGEIMIIRDVFRVNGLENIVLPQINLIAFASRLIHFHSTLLVAE